ncbi:MAG: hypothetical protein ABSB35_37325 [Bryobacteraceae bacterium]
MAGVEQAFVFGVVCEIEFYAIGVDASAYRLPEFLPIDVDFTSLHHLVSAEPIQMRKGDFPHQLVERILGLESTSLDVVEVFEKIDSGFTFLVIHQVRHRRIGICNDLPVLLVNAKFPFKQRSDVLFEQCAALRHDVAELVANLLVHVRPLAFVPPLASAL